MNSQIKKSERKNDNIITSELDYSNTKVKLKSLGTVELKCISCGDIKFYVENLSKVKNDREYVSRVLYHQVISPKMSLTKFSNITSNELIKLARKFVGHERHAFKYFKETNETEFFTNFREAIKTCYQKLIKNLQDVFEPMIESSKKVFEKFNIQYGGIIKQGFDSTSYITEASKEISTIAEEFRESQLRIAESLKPAIEQYQHISRIFSEVLTPQINIWQNWAEQNRIIFDRHTKFWQNFQNQYKISGQEAIKILRKYKWFISPSLPINIVFEVVKIGSKDGNQRKAINRLFIDYFSSNKFKNLDLLVEKWETNIIFRTRMKIFKDCILIMKNAKGKYNSSNLVIPTLISQIDGIRIEFMDRNGLSFRARDNVWKGWFKNQTLDQDFFDLANDIFLNILFQKSQPGEPLDTPFAFNRHKIMHGECLSYGRIDNTIRAFLILDLLATLSN